MLTEIDNGNGIEFEQGVNTNDTALLIGKKHCVNMLKLARYKTIANRIDNTDTTAIVKEVL